MYIVSLPTPALFSPVPYQLLAYISNYAEIRIDAKRVLYEYRRPFPRGAQDIGTWQGVLTAIATVAVATNAALVRKRSDTGRGGSGGRM